MSSLFEKVNKLGVLASGRQPRWKKQASQTGAPATLSAGVSTQESVQTYIQVDLRENVAFKSIRIGIDASLITDDEDEDLAVGETVSITVDATTETYTIIASDTASDILIALRDQINENATIKDIAQAVIDGDQIWLQGVAEAIEYSASVGGSVAALSIDHTDSTTAAIRIWRLPAGTSKDRPAWALFESIGALERRGLQDEIPTAGYSRVYCEVFDADNDITVTLGPCGLE